MTINILNPLASAKDSLLRVKFPRKDCQEGKHGYAGIWEGYGLHIRYSCSCVDSSAEVGPKRILKDMRRC